MCDEEKIAELDGRIKVPDPFRLSVEIGGVAAIASCLSALYLGDSDSQPSDEILGDTFMALEMHLERIADDVSVIDKYYVKRKGKA